MGKGWRKGEVGRGMVGEEVEEGGGGGKGKVGEGIMRPTDYQQRSLLY